MKRSQTWQDSSVLYSIRHEFKVRPRLTIGVFLLILAGAVRGHRVGFIPYGDLLSFHSASIPDILATANFELRGNRIHVRLGRVGPALAIRANGATGEHCNDQDKSHEGDQHIKEVW